MIRDLSKFFEISKFIGFRIAFKTDLNLASTSDGDVKSP